MAELFVAILLTIVSLFVLVKAADYLIKGASDIAIWLKVSPLLVGLTVVAFGTSLPEFIVTFFSALAGKADISLGNVIGSNIANLALVIGVCAIVIPLSVKSKTLSHEFPFMIISSFLLLLLANDHYLHQASTYSLSRIDGAIFMLIFGIFLLYIYRSMKSDQKKAVQEEFGLEFKHENPHWKNALLILGGIAGLYVGGKLFITGATSLATLMGLSDAFIGLVIAALGTSLPELAASGVAAWRGKGDLAIGNIVGSNIFNILFVMGLTSFFVPLDLNPAVVAVDGIIMLAITLLFLLMATTDQKITRREGIILLSCYVGYVAWLIVGI